MTSALWGSDPRPIRAFVSSTEDLLARLEAKDAGVFALTDGTRIFWDRPDPIILLAGGKARAGIELFGEGQAEIFCTDHSTVRLAARGHSAPRVLVRRYAELKLSTFGRSRATIDAADQSRVTLLAYESSMPHLRAVEFCIPVMIVHDQARPTCAGWPDGWKAQRSDIYIGQRVGYLETIDEAIAAAKTLHREWQQCRNRYIACQRVSGSVPKICPNVVDFRWKGGTVHVELPGDGNPRAWYCTFDHHFGSLTEEQRGSCMRCYLDDEDQTG